MTTASTSFRTILFIDDDKDLHVTLAKPLTDAAFQLSSAFDGEDGLLRAQREHPALIILDLILPRKTGLDVLRELKTDLRTVGIPVLVLTNITEKAHLEAALESGAIACLIKTDHGVEEIVNKIKMTLDDEWYVHPKL